MNKQNTTKGKSALGKGMGALLGSSASTSSVAPKATENKPSASGAMLVPISMVQGNKEQPWVCSKGETPQPKATKAVKL